MTFQSFLTGLILVVIGVAMVYSYVYYARKQLGAKIDLVQAVMYNVKTDGMPSSKRTIESLMRIPKFLGLILMVIGAFAAFNPR